MKTQRSFHILVLVIFVALVVTETAGADTHSPPTATLVIEVRDEQANVIKNVEVRHLKKEGYAQDIQDTDNKGKVKFAGVPRTNGTIVVLPLYTPYESQSVKYTPDAFDAGPLIITLKKSAE